MKTTTKEFFIVANSFAAPFFSDDSTSYQAGEDAADALERFAKSYRHPAGLYFAAAYESADAFHKGGKQLARWVCNHEREKSRLTKELRGYSYLGHGPGKFEINGKMHVIKNPKDGVIE